ncbi:unnamed protein product [Rotaria sp. Silwood2]|nr:unnamed protein product [Rotaria sp. Silwood2]CAF2746065.1 unnamed protein product [Rotaria sp. Silwood2]CAF3156328.1 unnamed protein product [Rotaria sp. Silwood2]CAF4317024.1 unnamed protein product [Rotaria sp. Silwood2]CAF4747393.1 unnamed protein product [Rotaria sp. Silwood2]
MFLYIKCFCISPEQWLLLLYGDTPHDLSMQIIIDNLSTPDLFSQAIKQFANVLRHAEASSRHLLDLERDFKRLSKIANDSQEYYLNLSIFTQLLHSIRVLLTALINF